MSWVALDVSINRIGVKEGDVVLSSDEARPAPADGAVRQVRRAGNCLVIHLAGEIDFSSAGRVLNQVTSAMDSARLWRVVLDLREVTFCDSSGLRALVAVWKIADCHAGDLTLARVPPACELPLVLTGLSKSLGAWTTITDAVASMRSHNRTHGGTARGLIEHLAAASQLTGTLLSGPMPASAGNTKVSARDSLAMGSR